MGNGESHDLNSPKYSTHNQQQFTYYNGHRVSRRLEDDYVDVSSDLEVFSKEEMEDQFAEIVVS